MPTPEKFAEMEKDLTAMIDKLEYYAEMAKEYSGDPETEESDMEDTDEEEMDEGEVKNPKGAAALMALKRKMKE